MEVRRRLQEEAWFWLPAGTGALVGGPLTREARVRVVGAEVEGVQVGPFLAQQGLQLVVDLLQPGEVQLAAGNLRLVRDDDGEVAAFVYHAHGFCYAGQQFQVVDVFQEARAPVQRAVPVKEDRLLGLPQVPRSDQALLYVGFHLPVAVGRPHVLHVFA